jgi:hypothetical protein
VCVALSTPGFLESRLHTERHCLFKTPQVACGVFLFPPALFGA